MANTLEIIEAQTRYVDALNERKAAEGSLNATSSDEKTSINGFKVVWYFVPINDTSLVLRVPRLN
jgi:hypothetical protein